MLPTRSLLAGVTDVSQHKVKLQVRGKDASAAPNPTSTKVTQAHRLTQMARAMRSALANLPSLLPQHADAVRHIVGGMHKTVRHMQTHNVVGRRAVTLWQDALNVWVLVAATEAEARVESVDLVVWGAQFCAEGFSTHITSRERVPEEAQFMGSVGRECLWRVKRGESETELEWDDLREGMEHVIHAGHGMAEGLARKLGASVQWDAAAAQPLRRVNASAGDEVNDSVRLAAAVPPAAGFTRGSDQKVLLWTPPQGEATQFEGMRKGVWARCKSAAEELEAAHLSELAGLHTVEQLQYGCKVALNLVRHMRRGLRHAYIAAGLSRWVPGFTESTRTKSGVLDCVVKHSKQVAPMRVQGEVMEALLELTALGLVRNTVWGYFYPAANAHDPHRWTAVTLAGALRRLAAVSRGQGGPAAASMLCRVIPIDLKVLLEAYGFRPDHEGKSMSFVDMLLFCSRCVESGGMQGVVDTQMKGLFAKPSRHKHGEMMAATREHLDRIVMMSSRIHKHGQAQLLRYMAQEGVPPNVVHDTATYLFEWGPERVKEFMRDAAQEWADPVQVAYQELQGFQSPYLSHRTHERVEAIAAACGGPAAAPHRQHTLAPLAQAVHAERRRREAALSLSSDPDVWGWMAPRLHGRRIQPGVVTDHATAASHRRGIVPWVQEQRHADALRSALSSGGMYTLRALMHEKQERSPDHVHVSADGSLVYTVSESGEAQFKERAAHLPLLTGDAARERWSLMQPGSWAPLSEAGVVEERDIVVAGAMQGASIDHTESGLGAAMLAAQSETRPTVHHPHVQAALKFIHVVRHLGYTEPQVRHMVGQYMAVHLRSPRHVLRQFWGVDHEYVAQLREVKPAAGGGPIGESTHPDTRVEFSGCVSWDVFRPALPAKGRGKGSLTDDPALERLVQLQLRVPQGAVVLS